MGGPSGVRSQRWANGVCGMEEQKTILYRMSTDDKRPTCIGYTNTHVIDYIRSQIPGYKSRYSRLFLAELCMRTSNDHLIQWISEYIECCCKKSADRTELYERDKGYYSQWDGESRIYLVNAEEGPQLLSNVETGIANFLSHANIVGDGIAQLSADLNGVNPDVWPCLIARIQAQEPKNFLSDICKILGQEYLADIKARSGQGFDRQQEKQVIKELGNLARWRNIRTHNIHLFAHLSKANGAFEIVFSDCINDLRDPENIRITTNEFRRAVDRFTDFLMWWCWRAEEAIGLKNQRSWRPKLPQVFS